MLEQELFSLDDPHELRALIRSFGWVTLASDGGGSSPVVSHLPVVLDEDAEGLVVLGHLAREDAVLHRLGEREVVLVVQGPHGYVSPSFYTGGPYVSTWNFVVVHLHGRPELLDAGQTYAVLSDTVDHFESARPRPWRLSSVQEYAESLVPYVTAFRLTPTRVVGKAKLSQDKPVEDFRQVVTSLEEDPVHAAPDVAVAMRHLVGPR